MNQNPKQHPRNKTDADLSGRMRFIQAINQFNLISSASLVISLKKLFKCIIISYNNKKEENVTFNVSNCLMQHFVEQRNFISSPNTPKND